MRILDSILRKLSWVPERDRNGGMVDGDNCYAIFDIKNPKQLFKEIINLMPNDSIWAIEGIYSKDILDFLKKEEIEDDAKVFLATAWPKQPRMKVKLSMELKEDIKKECEKWLIDKDIIHQHIYKDGFFYLSSYDNLKSGCLWITNKIEKEKIDELKANGLIGNYDEYPEEER